MSGDRHLRRIDLAVPSWQFEALEAAARRQRKPKRVIVRRAIGLYLRALEEDEKKEGGR